MSGACVSTYTATIFMAGDIGVAKQLCREECFAQGLCVHVFPVDYIYTGGEEAGFAVGLINYPRFPASKIAIWSRAEQLAEKLRARLCQRSYSIVAPDETKWVCAQGPAP